MSRQVCVLPQGFSLSCAADHMKHWHEKERDVPALEDAGEIEFLDRDPITRRPRYIRRIHGTQKTHISADIIRRASGAYEVHGGEIVWARGKVDSHGESDVSTFNSLVAQFRRVELPRIVWNDDGLEGNFASDGPAPRGNPVAVNLKPRTPQTIDAASSVWRFMTMRPATMRALAKSRMREWKESMKRLDRLWPQIVVDFSAGPFSEQLRESAASQLPCTIVHRVLEVFLQS